MKTKAITSCKKRQHVARAKVPASRRRLNLPLILPERQAIQRIQVAGTNRRITAKSSSRPASMQNERIHFTPPGSQAKVSDGPKVPKPGPTLLRQATTPDREDTKSS